MKLALVSDVHLEFADWYPSNPDQADVLLLAGDIMLAADLNGTYKSERFKEFLTNCKREYKDVIYIMGNHEHYNGDFATSHELLREACDINSIDFLDKEVATINNVTFIGGTLWTDMNKEDPLTLHGIRRMMNDFRCVMNSNNMVTYKVPEYAKLENGETDYSKVVKTTFKEREAVFTPEDAVVDHKAMVEYIRQAIAENPMHKYVVCGHHAPSKSSTKPRYEKEHLMNGGYSSSLEEFILDHSQIKLWTHGHTHEEFDYMIGSTRIVCNPRGYINYEDRADQFELKTFKI